MLDARNLTINYEDYTAVDDFSLEIRTGEILTIIGPNGSGKSTALRAMARLHAQKEGVIYLNGIDMKKMKSRQIARTLSIVSQVHEFPPDLTVGDLVGRGRIPHHSLFTSLSKADKRIVDEVLEETSLTKYRDRSIYALSGGERQRAFIGMALAQQPSLLLLDEPTTYLDISFQFELLELIKRLNRDRKLSIAMVLHDVNQAARYSDRLAFIHHGKLIALGSPWAVLTEERFREVYGMDVRIVPDEYSGSPFLIPIKISQK